MAELDSLIVRLDTGIADVSSSTEEGAESWEKYAAAIETSKSAISAFNVQLAYTAFRRMIEAGASFDYAQKGITDWATEQMKLNEQLVHFEDRLVGLLLKAGHTAEEISGIGLAITDFNKSIAETPSEIRQTGIGYYGPVTKVSPEMAQAMGWPVEEIQRRAAEALGITIDVYLDGNKVGGAVSDYLFYNLGLKTQQDARVR